MMQHDLTSRINTRIFLPAKGVPMPFIPHVLPKQ